MKLTDLLQPDRVIPDLTASEKGEVLRELVQRGIVGHGLGVDEDDQESVVAALEEREKLQSTGLKAGLAVPHARLPGLSSLAACLGRHPSGLDFGALDKEPSRVFIVLLSPESCGNEHLKALARISRLFAGGGLQRRLMECETSDEIFEALAAEDARL